MPKFVADLHIHSHYSRATSRDLDLEHLSKWAQMKGVHVVGTGDIAHPGWLQEIKDKLEPAEEGLFRLKAEYEAKVAESVPAACRNPVRFLLCGEVSNIYKKQGKVRKIHHLLFLPHLNAVEKLQARLERIGNIRSDGRPILGLDSHDLLEIILETDPQSYLIPAHIWTPWFAILGSMSGFDTIQECFDDLTPHIFALETGLSSDPAMNWRVSSLDGYTLISNSDAHSPPKLAREATLFGCEMSYPAIHQAMKTGDPQQFLGTLEFFPEEGKYHYDGHRNCNIRWDPPTTLAHKNICSVCGKPVTVGVMHRVETLADRAEGEKPARTHPFHNLIPLPEILGEVYETGSTAKQAQQQYDLLLSKLGPELTILQELPLEEIERVGGSLLAEGIRRVRTAALSIAAGYDGEYGTIKLFDGQERVTLTSQLGMFTPEKPAARSKPASKKASPQAKATNFSLFAEPEASVSETTPHYEPTIRISFLGEASGKYPVTPFAQSELFSIPIFSDNEPENNEDSTTLQLATCNLQRFTTLNDQQRQAVRCVDRNLLIVAGPGTGKTRTLTHRIAYLVSEKGVAPAAMLAITFTNKAAGEMATRLKELLGEAVTRQMTIKTFHALGAQILRECSAEAGLPSQFTICSEADRLALLRQLYPTWSEKEANQVLEQISATKNRINSQQSTANEQGLADGTLRVVVERYGEALRQQQMLDFDDLLVLPVQLFESNQAVLQRYQQRFNWLSVDEYQDINPIQHQLLRLLVTNQSNLCAIGDPDQAIYGFRGADRSFFLRFDQDFPNTHHLSLQQNYRSTQMILDASSQVISKESSQIGGHTPLEAQVEEAFKLDVYPAATDKAEAEYVVHQIEEMVGGTSLFSLDSGRASGHEANGRAFADFAVLYRLGAQSRLLVEAFERSGIPYQTIGQTPLVEYKEIAEIVACLWLIYNPQSTFYQEKLVVGKQKTENFLLAINKLRHDFTIHNSQFTIAELIDAVAQSLTTILAREWNELQTERVQKFCLRAQPFEQRLADFLEATALLHETDHYDPRADRVTLMTLHASKGLEFPVVFIVGCEETLLPYRRVDDPPDVDEERRLFYVGMTRAQQKLILSHAKTRLHFGQRMQNPPSRFLSDIEQTLKELKEMRQKKEERKKNEAEQLMLF